MKNKLEQKIRDNSQFIYEYYEFPFGYLRARWVLRYMDIYSITTMLNLHENRFPYHTEVPS